MCSLSTKKPSSGTTTKHNWCNPAFLPLKVSRSRQLRLFSLYRKHFYWNTYFIHIIYTNTQKECDLMHTHKLLSILGLYSKGRNGVLVRNIWTLRWNRQLRAVWSWAKPGPEPATRHAELLRYPNEVTEQQSSALPRVELSASQCNYY